MVSLCVQCAVHTEIQFTSEPFYGCLWTSKVETADKSNIPKINSDLFAAIIAEIKWILAWLQFQSLSPLLLHPSFRSG